MSDSVVIDGTTQPGYGGEPIVALTGGGTVDIGLYLTAGNSMLRGLAIDHFTSTGVVLGGGDSYVVSDSAIGGAIPTALSMSNVNGSTIADVNLSWLDAASAGYGISMISSSDNVIERVTATHRYRAIELNGTYSNNNIHDNNLSAAGNFAIYAPIKVLETST